MEAPPLREGVFSPEAAYYIDKLARKEEECNEILAQFNKYKVKTKVRFDQLRHEISNVLHEKNVDPEDEQHNPAMLLISLNETQFRLEEAEKLSLALRTDMERQQVHINDQIILIKSLEEQLRDYEESEIARERRRNEPVDLERVQQQMMYKDERIVELNSVILDKERQILDLQDACRSASEVATSKKEAMRIVQKKFDEMERRSRREASTETDDRVTGVSFDDASTPAAATAERAQRSMQQPTSQPQPPRAVRTASPGRAVHVVTKNGCSSPPPLDPAKLDDLPGTSKLAMTKVDGDSLLREKKQRKRVTFALDQAASREDISRLTEEADRDEITDAIVQLTAENDRLRGEVERIAKMEEEMEEMAVRVAQAESAVSEAEREARHASLKARAVAQARIKELEDRMAAQNALGAQQIDRLQVETETLRSTRDWEVEQNARMREQLAHTKEKLRQLREELDASAQANRVAEKKLDEKESLLNSLVSELEEAESLAVFLEDQKHQILDDVDQLKDIIKLHEEQINLLEADNLIYETRVGHLREELGVSKINQRDHIKSKAFNTKLQMINKEKEQIDRKANDERLRTKALHAKVQILEAENERLMARLCEAEMAGEDSLSLDAACKQLQTRMEQAEAESARVRTEFDARIHAAEFAADSLREECDKLRAERDASEQQSALLQQQYRQLHHDTQLQLQQMQQHLQQQHPGSTMQLLQHQQEDSSAPLEAALKLAQTAQETLARERDELAERVHVLGGENFELTRRTEEAEREVQRLESDLSRLESCLRESSATAAAADAERQRREERTVEREQELIDLRARVAERETTVERIEAELKRLRSELDHAHLSMAETAAVKKEVQHLQQQLEIEREAAATKWQQVMVQLKSYEELASNSGWDSRKTSIDETATVAAAAELRAARAEADAAAAREELRALQQAQQSLLQPHQLQHVQPVQHEVPRRDVSTEEEEEGEDRHEMDRLRARVEELESEVELSHELNVESGRTVQTLQQRMAKAEHEKRLLESLTVQLSEDIADMGEAAAAAPVAAREEMQQASEQETEELRKRMEELEEEAAVSEELHVEMGRTVQALEAKIREMEMERRLHEMMSVELTTELHELRQLQLQQGEPSEAAAEESAAEDAAVAAEHEAQLQLQLDDEKRQRMREQQAAREELHRLQLALHAAEDAKREVARQLAEREQTESLVRATAATFDAVAAATGVAGSTEEAQLQQSAPAVFAAAAAEAAEHEEERATLVQENVLLREAVYQNVRHGESVTSDVARLLELKEELEKAVEALRGEIWSLNGQLKASVLDRENLQDRVVELDTKVALEKRRADLLDVELAEQMELRENAQRQAAEAENESNRRLAECAEMDGKREDLEKAYALLAGYYSQLQEAYNVLYAQQANMQQERLQQAAAAAAAAEGVSSRENRATQTDAAASAAQPSSSAASAAGAVPAAVSSSSSSRRAMAEAYASRLASLRELSVQLTKSVLATELATLESELDNSITSIEGLSSDCPEAGASVDALLDAIIQDYDGSSAVSPDARAKIASVHTMLRAKISEVERVHSALREQRGVCTALEQRLTELEAAGPPTGLASPLSPGGASSSTVPSELEERIEECEALRAHVEQLQEIISRYVAREEAARLATREADVDSLFRTNAELAHENVRLQNELDEEKGGERKEKKEEGEEDEKEKPETTSSSTQTHDQQDFDEAELELIKEELEAEREARRRVEQRMADAEQEMREQKDQLEEALIDLSAQLQQQRAAAPAAEAAEIEELENAAAGAAAQVAALQADLDQERAARIGVEEELKRRKEEVEEMRTEMQLKEADGDEMKQRLQGERAAKTAAEKKAKEAELQQAALQEQLLQLQESKKEEDGWGNEGWGEEKEEESTPSSQELEELRNKLQQEHTARVAAEQRLQSVETERLQLQDELSRLQEEEKRVEMQPVQQPAKEEEEDGWGSEGWGEEKEEEETKDTSTSNDELAELRDKLEWERTAREEAEEEMKKMEEEKRKMEEVMKCVKKEGEDREELIRRRTKEMEEMQRRMREMEEKKEEKKEEEDGWGNDGWAEEKEEHSSADQSYAMLQLQQLLQQETAARIAAEQKRDELQRLQNEKEDEKEGASGWGEDWGEPESSTAEPAELVQLRLQLEKEKKTRKELEKKLEEAAELRVQLSEEIEALEKENARMVPAPVGEEGEGEGEGPCKQSSRHREEIEEKEEELASLQETYAERLEYLESDNARVRDTMVKYEKIIHDKEGLITWLNQKIVAMETGARIPPPPMDSDDEEVDPSNWDDGWLGRKEEAGGKQVYNTLENPAEEPVEEEVDYKRNYYRPEDPDEVSELWNILNDYIDEAADLQDESRSGNATAHHNERIRLRQIVQGMKEKAQELEDEFQSTSRDLQQARAELAEALEAAAAAEAAVGVRDVRMEEREEELRKEIRRLEKQNSLLQDGERKLLECLDGANTRVAETTSQLERLQQERRTTEAADPRIEELQQRVRELEADASAKASQLALALDSAAAAIAAKTAAEQRVEKLLEGARRRKAALAAAANGPAVPAAGTRSYVEGSRRTSAASSAWNEETHEEPLPPQPVKVDHAQLEQQVLLEAYRASLRDLLERVSEYLSEAESRDRSTAVTIDCLQLSVDLVNQQLEMGKKRGARGKRTTASGASDADTNTRTDCTAASESVSVVTTRESMTESMEDDYVTATAHSMVSSSEVELAEEERRHSLIGRSSPAHSPVDPAHSSSAHTDSIQDVRESIEVRLEAGGEEDETQSEGEDEQIGETIQKELHATRADLSSLRDGLASFVRDMGGWVQQQQSEKEAEKTEMAHLLSSHSQLETDLERAQVDAGVMETELEQANQAIWQLQQTAKAAAASAAQLEQRVAAAEEAAAAARTQLALQLEEETEGRARHERERARLCEQADELQRMLAAADAAAAATTAEAAAAREATRAAKRERDRIEIELSTVLEEAEAKIEQLEEDVRRSREQAQHSEVRLARMAVELDGARMEAARQSENLQQSAAAREKEEAERRIEQLTQQLQQLQKKAAEKAAESGKEMEEMKRQLDSAVAAQMEPLREINETLEQMVADVTIAKAKVVEAESQLEQERKGRAADRETSAAAATGLKEELQQLKQQLQQTESERAATAAEHAETVAEMETKLRQCQADIEGGTTASTELQKALLATEQQLQQARIDESAAAATAELNLQQAKRIGELEEMLQQSQVDVEAAVAAASQLKEAMLAVEQQLQQARIDHTAATATTEQQAKRLEELEEQLQLQQAQPARENMARVDLEEDIARMEMELARAQGRLEKAEESTIEANERAASSEDAAIAARQEVAILRSQRELDVQQQLLLQGSDEGMRRAEADERVRELERAVVERKQEIVQILEDLRSADERAAAAAARAAVAEERAATMENTMSDLRTQLDEAMGEAENLQRSMREVHHLEAALQQAHAEQSRLAAEAAAAREERRAMEGEKDEALSRVADLTEQLTQRTGQAIRASEDRNRSMSRMIELEQQMHAAAAAAATAAAEPTAQLQQMAAAGAAAPSASRRASFDVGARDELAEVAIDMPEVNLMEGEEERDESSAIDELLPRSSLVFASTPSPNVLDQLRSWLRRQARQSRALGGNRALMPYFRYAGALYVVFLQLAVIHCWFF